MVDLYWSAAACEVTSAMIALETNLASKKGGELIPSDPVNVDSNHYSVEFENDRVGVLRIRYGLVKIRRCMHIRQVWEFA